MIPGLSGLRAWHVAFFLAALALCAVALTPITLVLRQQPGQLSFASAEGSIWNARLDGVRVGALDAGEVRWVADPRAFLEGAVGGKLLFDGADLKGDGYIAIGRDGVRRLRASQLAVRARISGVAVTGLTTVEALDVTFADGKCAAAAGSLKGGFDGGPGQSAPTTAMTGTALCGGDEVWLPLEGAVGADRARFVLSLRADGAGKWQADVTPASVESAAALALAGFTAAPGEPYLRQSRTIQWLPF